jgi:voltage-gated potassium channel Kch
MELGEALAQWAPALLLSLFVLIGNPVIFMWIISRLGYGERTSFMTSVTVAQISEFSFIFAAMGLAAGLISEAILSVVAFVGLVTIAVSAYMILYNEPLYRLLRGTFAVRMFGANPEPDPEPEENPLVDHVIVVGMNALGRRLVEGLVLRGDRVLAVDTDPEKLDGLESDTLLGNIDQPAVLEEARLNDARLVVSALQIESVNALLAYRCREAGVTCSIHAFDRSVVRELRELGANHLMVPKTLGIRRMAAELRRRGVVGT